MPKSTSAVNLDLEDLLVSKGYDVSLLDSGGKPVPTADNADLIQFHFHRAGKDFGTVTISIDGLKNMIVYYDDQIANSGVNENDLDGDRGMNGTSWISLVKQLKKFAHRHQLGFILKDTDRLRVDMKRRNQADQGLNESKIGEGRSNDYFKRRRDEEDRIAGVKPPTKRKPTGTNGNTDYQRRRNLEKKIGEGVVGDDPWGDRGRFAGDTKVNIGGTTLNKIQSGDTVSYFGEKAKVVDVNYADNFARISANGKTLNVKLSDLKRVGGVAEGSEARYKVVFGRFGSIMPKPTFDDFKAAKRVADVQNGKVIDTTTGKVVYDSQSVNEGSLNEGQYEMMMRNGQVKKFIAKDDADAKRIASGHNAKSVIKLRGGVPAGKIAEQGVAKDSIEQRIAQAKKNNPLRASVVKKKYGYTALVTDITTGEPNWSGGAFWRTPELAMGHAKAFIKGFPYLEQRYAQRFIDKNDDGIITFEEELAIYKSHEKIINREKTKVPKTPKDEYARKVERYLKKKHNKGQNSVNNDGSKAKKLDEGYYGNRKMSYNDDTPQVKMIIKHNRQLEETDQRFRHIEKIFLETSDGERFGVPTTKPSRARMFARHIAEGGAYKDDRWAHLAEISEDLDSLGGFIRATRSTDKFNESAQRMIGEAAAKYNELRETARRLQSGRGYNSYFESYEPSVKNDEDDDLTEVFKHSSIDTRIEKALPTLSKLGIRRGKLEEADQFEQWADSILDESLELGGDRQSEAIIELFADELPLGPNAEVVIGELSDILEDDDLYARLRRAAAVNPNNDSRPQIIAWMQEQPGNEYQDLLSKLETEEGDSVTDQEKVKKANKSDSVEPAKVQPKKKQPQSPAGGMPGLPPLPGGNMDGGLPPLPPLKEDDDDVQSLRRLLGR